MKNEHFQEKLTIKGKVEHLNEIMNIFMKIELLKRKNQTFT